MSEDRKPTRLPPPAFPPGSRRQEAAASNGGPPIPGRERNLERGTVTGIGSDPHLGPEDLVSGGDPHVRELMVSLAKLAEAVRSRGEAGLRVTSEMSRFESTLRGYCLGYLVGRRAEDATAGRE